MDMAGADPKAAIQKIADELKEKFDECGMDAVEKFGDKLEAIKDKAANGPQEVMDGLKNNFTSLTDKVQEALDDPTSLAPGNMAACASWYGNAVVSKLKDLKKEAEEIFNAAKKLGDDITEPMKKLGDVLGSAMKELEGTLKKLSKLPAEIQGLAGSVGGAEDVAKIDTSSMHKCTDTSGISKPLDSIVGLKDVLGDVVEMAKIAVAKIADFIKRAPDMVKNAFNIPAPLCFLSGALMSQAPAPMTSMLEMVDKLKAIDLDGMLDMLDNTADTVMNLDIEKIKTPVEGFATGAKEKIGNLDTVVKGAKMATGGGGMMAAVKGLF